MCSISNVHFKAKIEKEGLFYSNVDESIPYHKPTKFISKNYFFKSWLKSCASIFLFPRW